MVSSSFCHRLRPGVHVVRRLQRPATNHNPTALSLSLLPSHPACICHHNHEHHNKTESRGLLMPPGNGSSIAGDVWIAVYKSLPWSHTSKPVVIQALWSWRSALLFIKAVGFWWVWRATNKQIRQFITCFLCILFTCCYLRPRDGYIDFCIYLHPSKPITSFRFMFKGVFSWFTRSLFFNKSSITKKFH